MDQFEELREKLKSDPQAKARFLADTLALLRAHGIDTEHPDIKDKLYKDGSDNQPTASCRAVSPQIIVCDED